MRSRQFVILRKLKYGQEVRGAKANPSEGRVMRKEISEEIDSAPILGVERGRIGAGSNRLLERGSHDAERVRQKIVRRSHHFLSSDLTTQIPLVWWKLKNQNDRRRLVELYKVLFPPKLGGCSFPPS